MNSDGFILREHRRSLGGPVIPVGWASSPSIKWDGQDARHFLMDRLEACPTALHDAPILIGYGHKTFENYYNSGR